MAVTPSPTATEWNADAPSRAPGPAAGLAYGGFWIRTLAFIIDGIVISVLTLVLVPLLGTGPNVELVQTDPNYYVLEVEYGSSAFGGLIGLLYFVLFWAVRGQTPGMMPFGLRVVRADDGGNVDIVRSILRYVGLLIGTAALLIGVIWAAFDPRKQGWHDKIAGTVVVRSRA
jgi:uncharacterized RDD family membrane protein YckC